MNYSIHCLSRDGCDIKIKLWLYMWEFFNIINQVLEKHVKAVWFQSNYD